MIYIVESIFKRLPYSSLRCIFFLFFVTSFTLS